MDMLSLIKDYARNVRVGPEVRIIDEGSYGDSFFFIVSGRVRVTKRIGEEEEVLRELEPGNFFGELALIHDKPRAASVISLEETELYEMGREDFTRMLEASPSISLQVLGTSTSWLLESDRQYIEKLRHQTRELALLLSQKDALARSLEEERRLLAQEKEKYQSLVEHSLVGVFVVQDERIVFTNSTFLAMTGYASQAQVEGLALDDIFIPGTMRPVEGSAQGSQAGHYEVLVRTAQGEVRTWEIRSVPIVMNSRGAVLSNANDLTGRKILEKQNEETRIQLMQESKLASIGILAAGIAHNLSNPLASVYTVAQLIRQEHPEMDEADRIIGQCRTMMNIIGNLMTKSRMDQSNEVVDIDLNELLERELNFYEANLDFKHNITTEYRYEDGLPTISGIYSDFSQAIMNIVKNAEEAMYESPRKHLAIRTFSDPGHIFVEITDTGCGIPADHLDKIFDPFFTTKPLRDERAEGRPTGTGLGMASSLHLVRKYHGAIRVRSTLGEGTAVTVVIPRGG
jgi:PAS domain S-box-containing protein